jgi:hypothetical protein
MDKKVAGLLGAIAALATLDGANASAGGPVNPADALHANSYAELLNPVPNAKQAVMADDLARANREAADMKLAQYYMRDRENGWDHHHHHHRYFRREVPEYRYRRFEHHHHHHQRFERFDRYDRYER